jgi:hypothetical protein
MNVTRGEKERVGQLGVGDDDLDDPLPEQALVQGHRDAPVDAGAGVGVEVVGDRLDHVHGPVRMDLGRGVLGGAALGATGRIGFGVTGVCGWGQ